MAHMNLLHPNFHRGLSAWWLVGPYTVMGVAEVYVILGSAGLGGSDWFKAPWNGFLRQEDSAKIPDQPCSSVLTVHLLL